MSKYKCNCVNVELGTYSNSAELERPDFMKKNRTDSITVDKCLEKEIQFLWSQGVYTTGNCCGHNKVRPMFNVLDESIPKMEKLGYEHCTLGTEEQNDFTFIPKSIQKIIPGRINSDHCDHCGLDATPEGHDGCLGTLPGDIMNACCGHGNNDSAYIQLSNPEYDNHPNIDSLSEDEQVELANKNRVTGEEAVNIMAKLIYKRYTK